MRGEWSPKSLTPPRATRTAASDSPLWYHGTPDERTWERGASRGLHVGTYEAARQALEATIGAPAEGDWDGTREYGSTPIVGNAKNIGYNSGLSCTDKGHPRHENARYSDGSPVPMDARPSIFPVRITGEMTNHPAAPMEDTQANGRMKAQLTRGQARRGYYYRNVAEDAGSVSAVVPSAAHLERLHPPKEAGSRAAAAESPWYHGSNEHLAPGDHVVVTPRGYEVGSGKFNYYTDDPGHAHYHAVAKSRTWGGDPHIYEVEPTGPSEPDPDDVTGLGNPYRSSSPLRVLREIGYRRHEAKAWIPQAGIFGPTTGLDPLLFDEQGSLRPAVRHDVMTRLDQCIRVDSGLAGSDWQDWTRVYLTGGSASEWAGDRPNEKARDLDVIVAIDLAAAHGCSAFTGMNGGEAASALNAAFWRRFNAEGWKPESGGTWNLTAFCNQRAQDGIAAIKPYAAYDLTDGRWAVRPPHLPGHSLADFDPAFVAEARAVAAEATAVLRLPSPFREIEASGLWKRVHEGRDRAFSSSGTGWNDIANFIEKWLAYSPGHLWDKIRELHFSNSAGSAQ